MFGRKTQPQRPALRQFGDLREDDFHRHPVWIACHSTDSDEPWFGETDEETFRPWTGDLPASPGEGMLLVRAMFELADGSRRSGFVTPAFGDGGLGLMQPHLFAGAEIFGFWGGMFGIPEKQRAAFYDALGKAASAVFPARFQAEQGLTNGIASGELRGFYRSAPGGVILEV